MVKTPQICHNILLSKICAAKNLFYDQTILTKSLIITKLFIKMLKQYIAFAWNVQSSTETRIRGFYDLRHNSVEYFDIYARQPRRRSMAAVTQSVWYVSSQSWAIPKNP